MLISRESLIIALKRVQKRICAYKSETFCDCKFGADHVGEPGEEGNGCPEVRTAIAILRCINDSEYDVYLERIKQRQYSEPKSETKTVIKLSKFDIMLGETKH